MSPKSSSNHVTGFRIPRGRLTVAMVSALMALAAFGGTAAQAASCPSAGAKQVFSQWGDQRNYVLAPDGGFEAGAKGWSLSGGAKTVAGNESFFLNSAADQTSLALPAGSSAGSPPVCMAIDTPVFRMTARNTGDPRSQLRVTASFKLLGLLRTQTIDTVTAGLGLDADRPSLDRSHPGDGGRDPDPERDRDPRRSPRQQGQLAGR